MKTSSFCLLSLLIIRGHGTLPVRISSTAIAKEEENACSSQVNIESQLNVTKEEIRNRISDTVNPFLNSSRSCGGSAWTRVAYLNMRYPGSVCPTNWTLHTSPVRGCGQTQTALNTCDSAFFSVSGQNYYSRVCGRILAYQAGSTDAFHGSVSAGRASIDSAYVDGVSLTHGPAGSRQHIWTFAAALYEEDPNYYPNHNCLCTNTRYNWPYRLPSFIQNNYFCDTGNPGPGMSGGTYYSDDPLWDGAGCGENSTCCQFNNPPWFYSTLPHATMDDMEVQLCFAAPASNENAIIYLLEFFVRL